MHTHTYLVASEVGSYNDLSISHLLELKQQTRQSATTIHINNNNNNTNNNDNTNNNYINNNNNTNNKMPHLPPLMPSSVHLLHENHKVHHLGLAPSFKIKDSLWMADEDFGAAIRILPLGVTTQLQTHEQ